MRERIRNAINSFFEKPPKMTGWISANLEDREMLENLGIKLGDYRKFQPGERQDDDHEGMFEECELDHDTYKKLEKYNNKFLFEFKTAEEWKRFGGEERKKK